MTEEQERQIAEIVRRAIEMDEASNAAQAACPKCSVRVHWGKRIAILGGTLVLGVVIHYAIDNTGLKAASQSAELVLAAILDSAFARIRESV